MTLAQRLTDATLLETVDPARPVLIAGPTASGKSALALRIAQTQGGVIVNADASQVYDCWRVLTARPPAQEEAQALHALYGHLAADAQYSAGHWLREVTPLLQGGSRPIIVGGTGLYFQALTQGLADIPPTPPDIRARGDALEAHEMLAALDAETLKRIDTANPARIQRAWEVLQTTGRGMAAWQDDTPPPILPVSQTHAIVFDVSKEWLNARIAQRFDVMVQQGALDEASKVLPHYNPSLPAHRAIGAPELIAHLRGEISLSEACDAAVIATRQFAKRQRTWFRSKMAAWTKYTPG
ncbi:MAG: tRNA (adenosine(37)-N6)-dimethylallyltransferase MiaA [Roseobacter sp.]